MVYQYAVNIENINDMNQLQVLLNNLSPERRLRIQKFHFTKDKIRCLIAESLVRYGLCENYGLKNEEIQFGYSKYGKPFLVSEKEICFNLSHSGEWVVSAVGDTSIGVDIEVVRGTKLPSAHKFFTKQEIHLLNNTPQKKQVDLFFKIWTLKESFVKYSGLGLGYPFEHFSFSFCNQNIQLVQENMVNANLSFISKKLDEKHWYALCMQQDETLYDVRVIKIKEILEHGI